jgi:FkbM family methyltransferase
VIAMHSIRRITRLLRRIPGGILIGEIVRRPFSQSGRTVRVDDFDGDLSIHLDLSEHMQSQIYWYGMYSRDITCLMKRVVRPGMTVIDGGANVGEITLVAAKLVGPSGLVCSFEPVDGMADQLERNILANNLTNVQVVRAGLAREVGEATIYLAYDKFSDGSRNDGLGTLFPSGNRSRAAGTIPLVTLDGIIRERGGQRVDLVKLDIEGGELAALQGAGAMLREMKPALILELGDETCRAAGYSMREIWDYLAGFGYTFSRIERKGHLTSVTPDQLREFQNLYCVAASRAGG